MTSSLARDLSSAIEKGWDKRHTCPTTWDPFCVQAIEALVQFLDTGDLRVAQKEQKWVTHPWINKGIVLFFRLRSPRLMEGTPCGFDKIPLKCQGWTTQNFHDAGFRMAPGALVRKGAYIAPQAVIMPSFINIGAYVGSATMVDSSVVVGSGAQIGRFCHLSSAAGIGGTLEPPNAQPVIIEDHCFIGAQCQIVEGVYIQEGSVIAMGTRIGASTKIINRHTGEITQGNVPPYSVVVPGTYAIPPSGISSSASSGEGSSAHAPPPLSWPNTRTESPQSTLENPLKNLGLSIECAIIVKTVDQKTRLKTQINDLLRE